jgi:hypothetical protein
MTFNKGRVTSGGLSYMVGTIPCEMLESFQELMLQKIVVDERRQCALAITF